MYVINLKKTGIINLDNCIATKRASNKIIAMTSQGHPECPYTFTLAEYKNIEFAKNVFDRLLESLIADNKIFLMPEESED